MPEPQGTPPPRPSRTPGEIVGLVLLVVGLVALLVVFVIVGRALR